MPVVINGSTGISGTDGSAGTPAYQGTDTNTGVFFPAADTIAFAEGGVEAMRIDSSGNVGIGTSVPGARLDVSGNIRVSGNNQLQIFNAAGSSGVSIQTDNAASAAMTFNTGGAERVRITTGGDLHFNSGYGSVATAYGCRAWVNFNGTGTVAIRASGNVSAITDHGTGDYTVNFTTALPDVNYATNATSEGPVNTQHCIGFVASAIRNTYSTTAVAVGFFIVSNSATRADPTIASLSVFR